MSATQAQDRPQAIASDFSAQHLIEPPPARILVKGKATGDYRISDVALVRAPHQHSKHTLVLDITAKVGPVQNPHSEIERVFPLQYEESPEKEPYTKVEIVNGPSHFTIPVALAE